MPKNGYHFPNKYLDDLIEALDRRRAERALAKLIGNRATGSIQGNAAKASRMGHLQRKDKERADCPASASSRQQNVPTACLFPPVRPSKFLAVPFAHEGTRHIGPYTSAQAKMHDGPGRYRSYRECPAVHAGVSEKTPLHAPHSLRRFRGAAAAQCRCTSPALSNDPLQGEDLQ